MCRASRVRARVDPARIPTATGFAAACARVGRDPLALALAGGEDYELLFTLRQDSGAGRALARRLGVRVTEIGTIEAGRPGILGLPARLGTGFRHF